MHDALVDIYDRQIDLFLGTLGYVAGPPTVSPEKASSADALHISVAEYLAAHPNLPLRGK